MTALDGPRVLTVVQPWAALIVAGIKDVENRKPDVLAPWQEFTAHNDAAATTRLRHWRGAIIGHCDITGCVRGHSSPWSAPGQFQLTIANAVAYDNPIPAVGALGLWRPDARLLATLRDADVVGAGR